MPWILVLIILVIGILNYVDNLITPTSNRHILKAEWCDDPPIHSYGIDGVSVVKRLAQNARVFEVLGILFALLAVGVACVGVVWNQQWKQRIAQQNAREVDTRDFRRLGLQMNSDGTVIIEGRKMSVEDVFSTLQPQYPNNRLHITVYVDPETPFSAVGRAISHLEEHGVQYEVRTSSQSSDTSSRRRRP